VSLVQIVSNVAIIEKYSVCQRFYSIIFYKRYCRQVIRELQLKSKMLASFFEKGTAKLVICWAHRRSIRRKLIAEI
jgi:hypothetical protein